MITYDNLFIISSRKGLMGPELHEDNMPVKEALESDIKISDEDGERELKNGNVELVESPDTLSDKLLSSGGTTPEINDDIDEFDITLRFSGDEEEEIPEQLNIKECDMGVHPKVTVKDKTTANQSINAALNDKSLNEIDFPDDEKVDQLNTDDESYSGKYLINDLSLAIQPCSSLGSKCGSKDKTDSAGCCAKKYSSMEKSLSAVLDDIDEVLNDCDIKQCNKFINKENTSQKSSKISETISRGEKDGETDNSIMANRDDVEEQVKTEITDGSDKILSDNGAKKSECFKSHCESDTDKSDNVPINESAVSEESSDLRDKINKNNVNSKISEISNDISEINVNISLKKQSHQNKSNESSEFIDETKEVTKILQVEKNEDDRMDVESSVSENEKCEKNKHLLNENSNLNVVTSDSSKKSNEHSSEDSGLTGIDKNDTIKESSQQEPKKKLKNVQNKGTKGTSKGEDMKERISESKRSRQELETEKIERRSSKSKKLKNHTRDLAKEGLNVEKEMWHVVSENAVDQPAKVPKKFKHIKTYKNNSKKNDDVKTSKKTELKKYSLKSSESNEYSKKSSKSIDYTETVSDDSIDIDDRTDIQTNSLSGKIAKKTLEDETDADGNQSTSSDSKTNETKDEEKSSKKRQLDEKQSSINSKRLKNDDFSSNEEEFVNSSSISENKKPLKSADLKCKSALVLKFLPLLIEKGELSPEAVDIEEFILTKIIEVITQRSELSELRDKINKQEAICDQYRQKIAHLTKQLSDMDVVVERLTQELKVQDRPVIPVKITRSVGLQVTLAVGPPRRPNTNIVTTPILKNDNSPTTRKKITRTSVSQSPLSLRPIQSKNTINGVPKNTPNDNSNSSNNSVILSKSIQVSKTVNNNSPRSGAASKNNPASEKPVIDLTDEDDNKKSTASKIVVSSTNVSSTVSTTTAGNMLIPINSGSAIVVAPQQLAVLTGTNGIQSNGRVSYIMTPAPVVANSQKQLLIGQPQTVQTGSINKNILRPTANLLINRPPTFNQKSLAHLANYPTPIVPNNLNIQNGVRPVRSAGTRLSTPINTNSRTIMPPTHPAPPPIVMDQLHMRGWKQIPPRPSLRIKESENGIQLSWSMPEMNVSVHEDIASYQIFAYQEQAGPPSTDLWRKVGDVKALPLPMACTLTSFQGGYQYYFAVRALDVHSRFSQFSYAQPISLDKLKS